MCIFQLLSVTFRFLLRKASNLVLLYQRGKDLVCHSTIFLVHPEVRKQKTGFFVRLGFWKLTMYVCAFGNRNAIVKYSTENYMLLSVTIHIV